MTDRVEQQLCQIFDKLFQKQQLERNIYIFNQMKPNLEVPLSLIARERKVMTVTNDERVVLQALKKCDRVVVNEEKKLVQIKLHPSKSKVVVKPPFDEKKLRDITDALLKDHLGLLDIRTEVERNSGNFVVNLTSDIEATQLAGLLEKSEPKLAIVLEEREPFQELKDSIERIKKQKKDKNQMFNPFEGSYPPQQPPQPVWQPPPQMQVPGYGFQYPMGMFPKPERSRPPGYTRRAVDSSSDEEPSDKRPKYRPKDEPKPLPVSYIEKRTRLNSENFPSLEDEAKVEQKVLKQHYSKKEIVEVFRYLVLSNGIKINKGLESSGIPLLKPEGILKLEAMKQGGRKESTFDSPKISPVGNRKISN